MLSRENYLFALFSIASLVIGILSTYVLADYFTVEAFGKIQLFLTVIGVMSIFYFSGFDIVIQKEIFEGKDDIVKYIRAKIMPWGFLFVPLLSIIVLFYDDLWLGLAFFIIALGLFDKTTPILNSKLQFKRLRYLELISKLALLLLVGVTILYSLNVKEYLILFTITTMMIIIARIWFSSRFLHFKNLETDYESVTKEGIKTSTSTAYTTFSNWFEKLVLGFIDVTSLAVFVIGQLIPKVLKDNIKVLLTPTLNTWASKGFEYYASQISKHRHILWTIGILLSVIIMLLVEFVISNFFVKYESSILIAQLLSLTLVFKFIELAKMSSLSLSKHTNIFNKINNISNTIKIVCVAILVPTLGIYGAVYAILVTEVIRFVMIQKEFSKLWK